MRSLIFAALLAISSASNAATAHFTGNMVQAQSVTYQYGWNCEYRYAGKTFWVFFIGTCPNSIEIQ